MSSSSVLRCQESIIDFKKSFQDPTLLKDDRVLDNLLITEEKYLPSPSYFKCVQTDIEPWMRNKVASWMLEVCEEQRCEEEVFPLAMNYIDRVLSISDIKRGNLQLLGAASIFIASKLRETIPVPAEKLVLYTAHSVSIRQLMEWELLILTHLKWDLSAVTPHDFLDQILTRLQPLLSVEQCQSIKRHALTFIALCYAMDFKFALYPPSMIAAGSVSTAAIGLVGNMWCKTVRLMDKLQQITSIEIDCLQACQEQIEKTLSRQTADISSLRPESRDVHNTYQPITPTDIRDVQI